MMRKAMQNLIAWMEADCPGPLLLTGCRSTGKTYLALDFAKHHYPGRYRYWNLEQNMTAFFPLEEADSGRATSFLEELAGAKTEERKQLLVLDEIHLLSKEALYNLLTALPGRPDLNFLFISSYRPEFSSDIPKAGASELCVWYKQALQELPLFPLDFEEYLYAAGQEWYVDIIKEHCRSCRAIPDILHQELMGYLKEYLRIGGMPASINEKLNLGSMENQFMLHELMIHQIYYDLEQKLGVKEGERAKAIWKTIPPLLSGTNKKFRYRHIHPGASRAVYRNSLDFLERNHLILRIPKFSSRPEIEDNFKLYYGDTGILFSSILHNSTDVDLCAPAGKGILENYVAEALYREETPLKFWESESHARIDFLLDSGGNSIPVELYPDENTRSKSIGIYRKNHDFPYAIKLSARNFHIDKKVYYLPLYTAFCIKEYGFFGQIPY